MPTLHFVPHTHWDREWYQPFEVMRLRLIHLVDLLLDIFKHEPRFKYYTLDGQTIVLEDYLQIRPDRLDEITGHVRSGRLLIGPWYVLPDEFLVSPEALVRNLLHGARDCARFGQRMDVGYLPDPFGHIGQMPQILLGFGIASAAFRRGLSDEPCEIWWEAPNGSRVLTAYLRDGYDNAASAPTDAHSFTAFIKERRDSLLPHCASDHLLLLNGTDHQEPHAQIASLIADYGSEDDSLLLSTLPAHIKGLKKDIHTLGLELPLVHGELRSPKRHHLLPGVLSSRVWIKLRNHECETLLERWAEPFSSWAEMLCTQQPATAVWTGHLTAPRVRQPSALLDNSWRLLMQCHPHDSICGCSVDQVHEEMQTRFDRVEQIGEEITRQSLTALADIVDTSDLGAARANSALVVFNPTSGPRTDLATAEFELIAGMDPFEIVDESGVVTPYRIVDRQVRPLADFEFDADGLRGMLAMVQDGKVLGVSVQSVAARRQKDEALIDVVLSESAQPDPHALQEGWSVVQSLLDDETIERYRLQARFATLVSLEMLAFDVPCFGYHSLALRPASKPPPEQIEGEGDSIENEHLRMTVAQDGTFTLTDKANDQTFPGLLRLSDQGDRGDSYTYCPLDGDEAIEHSHQAPIIRLIEDSLGQTLEVQFCLRLPIGLAQDRISRTPQTEDLPIKLRVSLFPGMPRADVKIEIDNKVDDHRLRVLIPLPFQVDAADYDGHYEIVRRPTAISPGMSDWAEQPAAEQPMRNFVAASRDGQGLMVATRGLREASVSEQGQIAITLLRSFGWLSLNDLATRSGGAGPKLPTPGGQSPGKHTFHLSLIPFSGSLLAARTLAEAFQVPMRAVTSQLHVGQIPAHASFLSLDPMELCLTSMKSAEEGDGLIVRIVNLSDQSGHANIRTLLPLSAAWQVRLDESPLSQLGIRDSHQLIMKYHPYEILSLRLEF